MTKMLDLVDTTQNLEAVANGLFFDGTTYYAVHLDQTAKTIALKTSTDLITWSAAKKSSTYTNNYLSSSCAWLLDGTTVYVAAAAVGSGGNAYFVGEVDTGTLAYTDRTLTFAFAFSIFKLGTDVWACAPSAGGDFWKWNTITYASDAGFFLMGAGYVDGSYYYFLSHDSDPPAAGHFNIRKWDGATFSAVSTNALGATAVVAAGPLIPRLFKQGNYEYITAYKSCMFQSTAFTWKYFDQSDVSQMAFYWDSGTLKIRYIYCNTFAYQILPSGQPIRLAITTSLTPQAAWDGYVTDRTSVNLYQLTPTTTTVWKTCITNDVLMTMPKEIEVISDTQPITDQVYKFYNDAGTLQYVGRCLTYKDDTEKYHVTVRSPTWEDLDQALDYTAGNVHADALIADLLDTYCKWITYDGTSLSSTPDHHYTQTWTSTTLFKILNEIAKTEGYWWSIDPNFILHFQRGVASGITITDASDGVFFPKPLPVERVPLPKSYYYLVGKWNGATGERDYVEDYTDANAALYYDEFPAADATELAIILTGLKSLLNQELVYARFGCYNKVLNVGDSFTLTLTKWSITGDTYYVQEVQKDLVANTIGIVCVSAISIPKQTPEQQNEQRIVNIEENVDAVNKRVDNISAGNYIFYLNNAASAVEATYKQLTFTNDAGDSSVNATITASAQEIEQWITESALGITILNAGQYEIHAQYKQGTTTGYKTSQVYWELYKRIAAGTETLLGTSRVSTTLTTTYAHQDLYVFLADDVAILSTDRLVIKLRANISGSGSNPVVYIIYGGTTYFSHLSFSGIATGVFAPLASPTFTGTVTHPTPTVITTPCAFRATNTAATTITNNSNTTVPFATEAYDLGSNYATPTFTAPYAGIYHFDFKILLTESAGWADGEYCEAFLVKNIGGSPTSYHGSYHEVEAAETMYLEARGHMDLQLAANDTVTVQVYQNSGGDIVLYNGANYNYFCGSLLHRTA